MNARQKAKKLKKENEKLKKAIKYCHIISDESYTAAIINNTVVELWGSMIKVNPLKDRVDKEYIKEKMCQDFQKLLSEHMVIHEIPISKDKIKFTSQVYFGEIANKKDLIGFKKELLEGKEDE